MHIPRLFVGLLLATLLLPLAACGGDDGTSAFGSTSDTVRLRGESEPEVGDVTRTSTRMRVDDATYTITGPGGSINATGRMDALTVTTETWESPDTRTIHFNQDLIRMTLVVEGQTSKETTHNAFHHQTVIARRSSGGQWTYSMESGSPNAEQQTALRQFEAEDDDAIYPAEPVEPGYEWEAPPSFIASSFGSAALGGSGEVYLAFEEVVDYNDERCARIRITLNNVEVRSIQDGQEQTMEMGGTGVLYRSLDRYEDIHSEVNGSIRVHQETTIEGVPAEVTVAGPYTLVVSELVEQEDLVWGAGHIHPALASILQPRPLLTTGVRLR